MVNFDPLAAEIGLPVWGTLANFKGFRVLAALLHDSQVVSVSQTAALNRGLHLYSAGRPSGWALAHILFHLWMHMWQVKLSFFANTCLNDLKASFFMVARTL